MIWNLFVGYLWNDTTTLHRNHRNPDVRQCRRAVRTGIMVPYDRVCHVHPIYPTRPESHIAVQRWRAPVAE
uniref:Secreted protein n=1 Tax=Haemonchus placei TaxID=6290 RepID=A0A0N4XC05_HAEPC